MQSSDKDRFLHYTLALHIYHSHFVRDLLFKKDIAIKPTLHCKGMTGGLRHWSADGGDGERRGGDGEGEELIEAAAGVCAPRRGGGIGP